MIILTILFTAKSAFCYRIGGMCKEAAKVYFPWFPQKLVKSWFRDINCSLIVIVWALLYLPHVAWWRYLVAALLLKLAISTYWDDRFINWMKPRDNFFLHGFFLGLAILPIYCEWIVLAQAVVSGLFMGIVCHYFSDDFIEEYSRGGAIVASLPILLI